jgi:excisionase family DNA binding protein
MDATTRDEFMTLREAAQELRLSVSTLKRYIYAGQLRSYRTPGGRHRVKRSDLAALLGADAPLARSEPAALAHLDRFADEVANRVSHALKLRMSRIEADVERLEYSLEAITAALRRASSGHGPHTQHSVSMGMEIKVLGPGCRECDRLAALVAELAGALGLGDESISRVREIDEIAEYGPTPMPALVINNELVAAGRTPSRSRLAELLEQYRAGRVPAEEANHADR